MAKKDMIDCGRKTRRKENQSNVVEHYREIGWK